MDQDTVLLAYLAVCFQTNNFSRRGSTCRHLHFTGRTYAITTGWRIFVAINVNVIHFTVRQDSGFMCDESLSPMVTHRPFWFFRMVDKAVLKSNGIYPSTFSEVIACVVITIHGPSVQTLNDKRWILLHSSIVTEQYGVDLGCIMTSG